MIRRHILVALSVAALLTGGAAARDYSLGTLTIAHLYVNATPATAATAAGYLSITNGGAEPDRLMAIRTAFPKAQIHSTEMNAEGVATMRPVEQLEIPAGETVTLAPRGLHVMLMGLKKPLVAGTSIPATLVFERAGEVAVEFEVEPRRVRSKVDGVSH